jgi:hypothetical protein
VTLFADIEIRPRRARRLRARGTIQIPTGSPRLIESPSDRRVRERLEARAAFAKSIVESARVRLRLLSDRHPAEAVACPWQGVHDASCRCDGTGNVSVGFLVDHYRALAEEFGAW